MPIRHDDMHGGIRASVDANAVLLVRQMINDRCHAHASRGVVP